MLGNVMTFCISAVLNIKIKDTQCGYKLYKKKVARLIFSKLPNVVTFSKSVLLPMKWQKCGLVVFDGMHFCGVWWDAFLWLLVTSEVGLICHPPVALFSIEQSWTKVKREEGLTNAPPNNFGKAPPRRQRSHTQC